MIIVSDQYELLTNTQRTRPEHDWYELEAHRAGENLSYGKHMYEEASPRFHNRNYALPVSSQAGYFWPSR